MPESCPRCGTLPQCDCDRWRLIETLPPREEMSCDLLKILVGTVGVVVLYRYDGDAMSLRFSGPWTHWMPLPYPPGWG